MQQLTTTNQVVYKHFTHLILARKLGNCEILIKHTPLKTSIMRELKKTARIVLTQVLVLSILIALTTSCEKDDDPIICNYETEVDLGQFSLLPESRQSIPYSGNQRIYFKDELQNEIYFDFSEENEGYHSPVHYGTTVEYECNDSAVLQHLSAEGDAYWYNLTEPQHLLNMTLHLQLNSNTQTQDYLESGDFLLFLSGTEDYNEQFRLIDILVNRRDLSDEIVSKYPTSLNSVYLGGKKYNNVYTNETNSAYYNFEQGIIAFTDNDGKFWIYDRIENID